MIVIASKKCKELKMRICLATVMGVIVATVLSVCTVLFAAPALAQSTVSGVCDRTPQVRDALLAGVQANDDTVTDCSMVTTAHLQALTGTMDLSNRGITSLKPGDLTGLTNLVTVFLTGNALTGLPDGIFGDLTNLQKLYLYGNDFQTLTDGVFEGLANLSNLNLSCNDLQTLPGEIFDGLANLEVLNLSCNDLQTLPGEIFEGLTSLENLYLYDNDFQTLPNGIFDDLANLRYLFLNNNNFQTLPGGIFEDLLSLRNLHLNSNDLQTLPGGIFEGLAKLRNLFLQGNDLQTLPDDIFEDLASLGSLYLVSNPGFASFLPAADAGEDQSARLGETVSLDGSGSGGGPWGTNFTYYWSVADDQGNPVTDLTLTGGNTATPSFVIPETALTSEFVVTLTVQGKGHRGGGLYRSTDSMSVVVVTAPKVTAVALASAPASGTTYGNGESIEVVVTFEEPATVVTSGGTPSIGLTVGTAAKTAGYLRGSSGSRRLVFAYEVQASDTDLDGVSVPANSLALNGGRIVNSNGFVFRLTHEALTDNSDHKVDGAETPLSGGVCGRTAQVRAALLAKVQLNNDTVANCSQVTTAHLQALTGTLSLTGKGIIVLKSGDFASLTNLTGLYLQDNNLLTLPDGIFDGLPNLLNLNLQDNDLQALPVGIFESLVKLRNLNLYRNDLQTLPGEIFEGLASLRTLNLYENYLQTLPGGIFEGLASLQFLYLQDNDLQTLPDGIFEGLAILRTLSLIRNPGFASFLPTAYAGQDQNSELGMTVSFDGSIGGPWGTNITYDWSVADGQGNPVTDLTLTGGDTTTPSFVIPETAPTSGYVVTLTVLGKGNRGGDLYKSTDSVSVAVAAASTVTAVALASAPASGTTYGNGESIEVVVTFEEPATVVTSGGTPSIGLTVGTAAKTAGYLRGSGSRSLVFAYEVQASDTDLDGVSVSADSLARNGGRIVNSDGSLFRLTHEALTDNSDHKVNGAVTPLSGGVCGRTAQVRAALLARVQQVNRSVANCSQVTPRQLHELTGPLLLGNKGIVALKSGDFANLANFTRV